MSLLSYLIPQTVVRSGSRINKEITVIERAGHKELYVNGVQQSGGYTNKLWNQALVSLANQEHGQVKQMLVLGVGGATVFPKLQALYPCAHIVGVDIDPEIIRISKVYFGTDHLPDVSLVCSDARDYVKEAKKHEKTFDLVVIDLYVGNDVPNFAISESFLISIRDILSSQGRVVLNYFIFENQPQHAKELFDKLRNIFPAFKKMDVFRNVFFYCDKIEHNVQISRKTS